MLPASFCGKDILVPFGGKRYPKPSANRFHGSSHGSSLNGHERLRFSHTRSGRAEPRPLFLRCKRNAENTPVRNFRGTAKSGETRQQGFRLDGGAVGGRRLLPVSPNGSNSRMLICIACRNGDVPAKICVKSLEKKGVSVLHENLRLKRKERGLSQEELASRLHVVRQTISKWEKGMSVPDSEQLIKIAVILETTVSELLGTQVENEEEPNRLAKELSRINTQLAIRNHRTRRVLKCGRSRCRSPW